MRILVAEDDPVTLKLVCRSLEGLGHQTTAVTNGEQAWTAYTKDKPDVVISDWQMPGCSGIELCERVRSQGDRYTYFILLTSHTDQEERLDGMKAGADDYLAKPLVREELILRLIAAERITRLHSKLHQQQQELERLNQQLYRDGRRCALTGIANRLQLGEDLAKVHAMTHRHDKPYCLAIFDIDFFKRYNDTCGHVAGDEVLRQVALALESAGRMSERVYRYGGEEFVALFVFGNVDGAMVAAERMRQTIETLAIEHPGHPDGGVLTVSGGVVCYTGEPRKTAEALIEQADSALYQAKSQGRNQVVAG